MTLTSFSRSHDGLYGWQMACLHPISWMKGWIFTKLVHLYCWDMEKNWLDFGDLDPIFKVTGGLRLLENGLSALYLMKEWMDFDQTCTTILLWHEKELIRFPLIQEGQLSVSGERMCTILVNRLEDKACPVNVWLGKLTALDMTPLGWLGPKTSTQTNTRAEIIGKCLVCNLSGMDGFWPNLHNYIVVTSKRTD